MKLKAHFIKYVFTAVIVGTAALIQWALWPYLSGASFLLFYPAVILASLYGDGLSAIFGSVLITYFFFMPNGMDDPAAVPGLMIREGVFIASALMIRQLTRSIVEGRLRIKKVLEGALDAVVVMNTKGEIVEWNAQAEKSFGFTRAEVIGKQISEIIIPAQYRQSHIEGLRKYLATGIGPVLNKRIEVSALNRDGREFPVELTISPTLSGAKVLFYAFLRDISQSNKLTADLEKAVSTRDEFISIAGHELKTPVTTLKLHFELAARQIAKGDPKVYEKATVDKRVVDVNRQLNRMSRLIEDMLDVTKMSGGRLTFEKKEADLSELVQYVATQFADQFSSVGASLTVKGADKPVKVFCDVYRIEQVISNLLTNAMKYGAGKPVLMTVSCDSERAHVEVSDQGRGIGGQDLGRIFERFERAEPAPGISGLGLGLYISRKIVEAHGGSIHVESRPGEGSKFALDIPAVASGVSQS